MPPDAQALIAALPPWAQVVLNIALAAVALATSVFAFRKGHANAGKEREGDKLELDEILESSPVRRFVEAFSAMADQQRRQADALCGLMTLAEAEVKHREFDREVERRVAEQRGRT